ncbi:unnamed protein product [Caenorhabditis brenneri]
MTVGRKWKNVGLHRTTTWHWKQRLLIVKCSDSSFSNDAVLRKNKGRKLTFSFVPWHKTGFEGVGQKHKPKGEEMKMFPFHRQSCEVMGSKSRNGVSSWILNL